MGWDEVEDRDDNWSLHWKENDYRWTPVLDNNIGIDRITNIQWHSVAWSDRLTAEYGNVFAMADWDANGSQTQAQFLANNWSIVEGTMGNVMTEGEYAIMPKLTFDSVESSLLTQSTIAFLNWRSLGTLSATETAPRVGKVGIDRVEWVATTCPMTANPAANGGGQRIFPEKATPTDDLNNQIGVRVVLTSHVPAGMTGLVSLVLLDPMNQCSDYAFNLVGTQIDDNNGSAFLAVSSDTYDPSSGATTPAEIQSLRTVVNAGNIVSDSRYMNITQANAGDNYIVAVHPNSAAEPFITINSLSSTKDYAVYRTINISSYAHQTELLTVWRTLWVEIDQMTFSVAHTPGDPIEQIPGTTVVEITGYFSNTLVYTADKPDISDIPQRELARTCIELKEYSPNINPIVDGIREVQDDYINLNSTVYDQLISEWQKMNYNSFFDNNKSVSSQDTFWTVHVISAFSSNTSGTIGSNYCDQIMLFNEEIETVQSLNFVLSITDAYGAVLLHEICHSLGFTENNAHTISGVMKPKPFDQYSIIVDISLTVSDIRLIQQSGRM